MKKVKQISSWLFMQIVWVGSVWASTQGSSDSMPWEQPLMRIANSLKGPVATAIALVCICACGFRFFMGESHGGMRTFLSIVFGMSMIVFALNIFQTLGISTATF
ncbi:MAG: TrbC/VirB2 family protein [Candidatus Omnitrophica bacterium]|nr:TrbC/VirB2 family protein [Candidatus Omnitrophota bacterium]